MTRRDWKKDMDIDWNQRKKKKKESKKEKNKNNPIQSRMVAESWRGLPKRWQKHEAWLGRQIQMEARNRLHIKLSSQGGCLLGAEMGRAVSSIWLIPSSSAFIGLFVCSFCFFLSHSTRLSLTHAIPAFLSSPSPHSQTVIKALICHTDSFLMLRVLHNHK